MKSELKTWTWNAEKWREENGYTTPEWEMYVQNATFAMKMCLVFGVVMGFIIGYVW